MPELLILNPIGRRRGKKKRARKSRRSSKRRHAHVVGGHTVAKKRKSKKHRFHKNPVGRHHKRRHRRHHFRRNPASSPIAFAKDNLLPATIGAGSAIALDVGLTYLPLPVGFNTGPWYPLVRIGAALGLGLIAAQFVSRDTAAKIASGALTVTLYDVTKKYIAKQFPTIPGLSGFSSYPALAYAPRPSSPRGIAGTPSYLGGSTSPMESDSDLMNQDGGEWLGETPSYLGAYENSY